MKCARSAGMSSWPLAQRRHHEAHDIEPEVEVLAELPLAHQLLEVAVRRRHEAHVELDRLRAADPVDRLRLQEPQELHLDRAGDLADLVQEERPAVRRLEAADPPLGRAR